jgi:hypothetical protein
MNKNYKCQGDVAVLKIDRLPKDAKKVKGATLALGEHSGHHHTFYDSELAVADKSFNPYELGSKNVNVYETENHDMFIEILKPVFLKHQEHKTIPFDEGMYKVGIIRQFDYDTLESKRVVD